MHRTTPLLIAVLGLALPAYGAGGSAQGIQLKVTVIPDSPEVMLAEPDWLTVRVENRSKSAIEFYSDLAWADGAPAPSASVEITGSNGRQVARPYQEASGSSRLMVTVRLGPGEKHDYRLLLSNCATLTRPDSYSIIIRWPVRPVTPDGAPSGPRPGLVKVSGSCSVRVTPNEPARLGEVIERLGKMLETRPGAAEQLVTTLGSIDDERTIPYLRHAFLTGHYAVKFKVPYALAKFTSDSALEGMMEALAPGAFSAEIAANPPNPAAVLDRNIRGAAGYALLVSKHPKALDYLIAERNLLGPQGQETILQALRRKPAAEAVPILEEIARGPDAGVGQDAARLIAEMSKPGFVPDAGPNGPPVRREGNTLIIQPDARPGDLARFAGERKIESVRFGQSQGSSLSPAFLTAADLTVFAGWPDLKSIQLGPIPMSDATLAYLAAIPGLETVWLNLWVTDAGLAQVAKMKNLTSLSLDGLTSVTDRGIGQLRTLTKLKRLTLGDLPVSDATVAKFAGMTNLEEILLYRTRITDRSLSVLAGLHHLRSLDLRWNAVTDRGLAALERMPQLTWLALGEGNLGDAGMAHIAKLANLEYLSVHNSRITDASIPMLAELTNLKSLDLAGTRITAAGARKLEALSKLNRIRNP